MTSELSVWFTLLDANRATLLKKTSVTMQSGPNCRIDHFKDAVYAKVSRILPKDMIAAQLDVYNMAELEAKNPVALDATKGMTQYDANMSCPLVVVAPIPSAAEGPYKKQRVDIDPDPAPELPQIDISGSYVMIPRALLQPASIGSNSDILLYRRAQVDELWQFLNDQVIADKKIGYIVGPPGTGKSMCTLSFLASLDRTQWRVIWIHLTKKLCSTFLDLGTNKSWLFVPSKFEFPDYLDGQNNLFVCLDGLNNFQGHDEVFCLIQKRLGQHGSNRFVVCSSMATLGKRNREDDKHAGIKFFYMYSWTRDEYREAVNNRDFFNLVKDNLDATLPSDVNDTTDLTSKDHLDDMVDLKFYYAGGSCRHMFQYQTQEVKLELRTGIKSAKSKPGLIEVGGGEYNEHQINKLYRVDKAWDGDDERTAVSEYAQSLFVKECGTNTIAQLAQRLGVSKNPSMHGHFFEWLFFATVCKKAVELESRSSSNVVLPQATVIPFDPKKKFRIFDNGEQKLVFGDKKWLKPILWNQGGYDAVYFDMEKNDVIFIQLTISPKHDLKLEYFAEVLLKLEAAGMKKKEMTVKIYFVIKEEHLQGFKIGNVADRGVLEEYDEKWSKKEEDRVLVLAFKE